MALTGKNNVSTRPFYRPEPTVSTRSSFLPSSVAIPDWQKQQDDLNVQRAKINNDANDALYQSDLSAYEAARKQMVNHYQPVFSLPKLSYDIRTPEEIRASYDPAGGLIKPQKSDYLPTAQEVVDTVTNHSKSNIVSTAKDYIGQNRYVYGGFDCSKFTQEVAAKNGVNIGRDTASQMAFFKNAGMFTGSIKDAKPGDVLYFRSSGSKSGRHTGIYIGGGLMIDNAGRGKPIKTRSIAGRTLLGVGKLSSMYHPRGDSGYGREDYKNMHAKPGKFGLHPKLYEAISKANYDMAQSGIGTFGVSSGHRTDAEQRQLVASGQTGASPSQSVHTMTPSPAVDLDGSQAQLAWLKKNAQRYGLIPSSEPWHFSLDPRVA